MTTASNVGTRLDIVIKQGATFELPFAFYDAAGAALNITSYILRGQIRRKALSTSPVVASFTTSQTGTSTAVFRLSAAVTAAIAAGELPTMPASRYVYDVEIESAAGVVTSVRYGTATIHAEVTRAV